MGQFAVAVVRRSDKVFVVFVDRLQLVEDLLQERQNGCRKLRISGLLDLHRKQPLLCRPVLLFDLCKRFALLAIQPFQKLYFRHALSS